jgi:hypothetical protein
LFYKERRGKIEEKKEKSKEKGEKRKKMNVAGGYQEKVSDGRVTYIAPEKWCASVVVRAWSCVGMLCWYQAILSKERLGRSRRSGKPASVT